MNAPQQRGGQAADVDELLPCPFCGNPDAEEAESVVPTITGGKKRAVYCNACFCEGPTADTSRQAISAWNARALTSAPPAPSVGGWVELTDEDRERAMRSMPDMLEGFMKTWGWLHYAKAIEAICREKNALPQPPKEKP